MATLQTAIKGEALAAALERITGERPFVRYVGSTARLSWSTEQLPAVRAWFEAQMSREPGDVQIDFLPVVTPYILRKAGPPAILAALATLALTHL